MTNATVRKYKAGESKTVFYCYAFFVKMKEIIRSAACHLVPHNFCMTFLLDWGSSFLVGGPFTDLRIKLKLILCMVRGFKIICFGTAIFYVFENGTKI